MRYTLRQLEVFFATARFENISRAAEHLSMSQSAASAALRELEQQFDVRLFDRVGKRLQLNELGQLLRPKVKALLEQGEALEWALALHDGVGLLKVGATLAIGNYLAVAIMARFMREQVGAQVQLEVANTASIAAKIKAFELDIGLIEGDVQDEELEVIPWHDDELVVFCAPTHRLAQKGSLSDRDLLEANWIMREPGSGTRQVFERAMHGLLPQFKVLTELQHTEAVKNAVAAGLGISCLSRITLADEFRRGALVPLAVPHRDLTRKLYFVLNKHKYRSAGIEKWMQLCYQADTEAPVPTPVKPLP
jgi:DNA-binding transcriptional LysR family regulator